MLLLLMVCWPTFISLQKGGKVVLVAKPELRLNSVDLFIEETLFLLLPTACQAWYDKVR